MILKNVTVTEESYHSEDSYEIILSNIDVLNSLLVEHVRQDEVCIEALKSYYVDYYLAQMENGGFSQFVYNSNWEPFMIELITSGLKEMGAINNLKMFQKSSRIVSKMSANNFQKFIEGEYFGNFLQINFLNKYDDRFYKLQETENLVEYNSKWLKSLSNLKVLNETELNEEISRLLSLIPDKAQRVAEALEAEPRHKKIMRALCKKANQTFEHETAASPTEIEGISTFAFHFITNEGHHHMVDINGKGLMFKGHSDEIVAEIEAGDEFGT